MSPTAVTDGKDAVHVVHVVHVILDALRGLLQCGPKQKERSSGLCRASPTLVVGASEVEVTPNGFALLTAAPENGWSCG